MEAITTERILTKPPHEVWPVLSDLARWLEPGVRFRVDENETEPGTKLIARLWEQPGASSHLAVELAENEDGGSTVTVTQTQDRHFAIDASLSANTRSTIAPLMRVPAGAR